VLFRLELEGCAAADYRLSGDAVDHICSLHLHGRFRALVCFPDNESILILLVGEHRRGNSDDIYDSLFELLDIAAPEGRRAKPPCCDDEGEPRVDADLVDRFRASANRLRRRR
jgi:hypothetical protein